MRGQLPERLESGRVTAGQMGSDPSWGAYGLFFVFGPCGEQLKIIASGGDEADPQSQGWEHVSVSTARRTPNWREMCFVKDLFWSEEETVIQFHPPYSEYVNNHPHCLHLWRHKTQTFPMPPSWMVGLKGVGELTKQEAQVIEALVRT